MKRDKRSKKVRNSIEGIVTALIVILISLLVKYVAPINDIEVAENTSNEYSQSVNANIVGDWQSQNSGLQDSMPYQIDSILPYAGEIVININNNVPYFEEKDISTEDFEYYSNLDELNRAGVAFANICKLTMPPEGTKRESLSYKPSGWNQYLYGENNRYHLYERCHLIAWQLGNENNNKRNLITGTSQLNSAMIEYENIVANWIKQKNKENKDYHVLYRVTPIYEGNNKLAKGIEIEAKSVEEEGVSFNKFIYNVQDNFKIDYYTGKAELIE